MHLAPDAPADRARQLARARRAGRPLHHRHVGEARADAALARRAHLRRQGRRVRALHGPAVPHPGDARGGARGGGAARAHRGRRLAAPRRARRVGDHGRLPRLPPRLARRVLDREERLRGAPQRLVLDPDGGLPRLREAGGGAGDGLVRPRAARARAPCLHDRRGGGGRAGGRPRRLCGRLPARARGRRGVLPRRGRVRAPPRRRGALGGAVRIVLAGYLVRNPLGGYAWQAAHYLLGLRALGHDAWFYEDTGHYAQAYNPRTNEFGEAYAYGIRAAGDFLGELGLGERWVFVDTVHGEEHGPAAGRAAALVREADLLINLAGVNRIPPERRAGRPAVYIDIDPAFTQIKAAEGDALLRAILDEHAHLFTFGENIGTPRSPVPTADYLWHATRAPIALDWWADAGPPARSYPTVGKWDAAGRDATFRGETFAWRKRTEWLRCLELPKRTGRAFEVAMDVDSVPGDRATLAAHGWQIVDPLAVSADPWRYRDYLRGSRGEFTVAKDMNVRLRSGWFSDRAACYLAAGRPVVGQDTGFGGVLPLGPGVHAFRVVDEAAAAVAAIEADYARASAHAAAVAPAHLP